jgi:hypothetical protein
MERTPKEEKKENLKTARRASHLDLHRDATNHKKFAESSPSKKNRPAGTHTTTDHVARDAGSHAAPTNTGAPGKAIYNKSGEAQAEVPYVSTRVGVRKK